MYFFLSQSNQRFQYLYDSNKNKPPDETVKSSKHISHYRLLFIPQTLHDSANGFSPLFALQSFIALFCVWLLIYSFCA